MEVSYSVRHYARPFLKPLSTAYGVWVLREGFIIRAESADWINYGEVAPLPEFGSETLAAAEKFLCALIEGSESVHNPKWLAAHPACAFGISTASRRPPKVQTHFDYNVAALLPAGEKALSLIDEKVVAGYSTFKWKIGVYAPDEERQWFLELLNGLPSGHVIRLDANGSLDEISFREWVKFLEPYRDQVDFFEQPMALGNEQLMGELMMDSGIPIALDESLNGPEGSRWLSPDKWEGPFIVKAPLMGDWGQLLRRLDGVSERVVFSSVYETQIGLQNALSLADQLCRVNKNLVGSFRPFGYDTLSLFADDLPSLPSGPILSGSQRLQIEPDKIWNQLEPSY